MDHVDMLRTFKQNLAILSNPEIAILFSGYLILFPLCLFWSISPISNAKVFTRTSYANHFIQSDFEKEIFKMENLIWASTDIDHPIAQLDMTPFSTCNTHHKPMLH